MRKDPTNPPRNCLPPGVDESELVHAIETSGYPLQGLTASKLVPCFDSVTEEWGYIDRDTEEHRSLDVIAFKDLCTDPTSAIKPSMLVLAECKRSIHPFVFFKDVVERAIFGFPEVAALKRGIVEIHEASGKRQSEVKGAHALGLNKLPFVEHGPATCSAFSRATLSGKKVDLSGEELFKGVVLPLVKAFDHARSMNVAGSRDEQLFPKLILSMTVVEAPMLLVESPSRASDPILTPWVRIARLESIAKPEGWERFRYYGIDVVHIDFLDEYLSKHLLPFAEEFSRRAVKMAPVLFKGGVVQDLDKWDWEEIRPKTT
jgi:hypothetical protein